jgi:hypothetical protein
MKGKGEGKRERERGAHLRDPNFGDHHLQNLGHHGEKEREMGEREIGCCTGEIKLVKGARARAWGAGGARGARAKLGWVGLG